MHSLADKKVYLMPNTTDGTSSPQVKAVVAASLEQIIAVRGNQTNLVVGISLRGFRLRHSAAHYTGPNPTCGGGDFCAARTGTLLVTGAENITISGVDISHPGGNGIAVIDHARGVEIANCSLTYIGEVGFVVQGQTTGIDATPGNYPVEYSLA